MSRRLLGKVAQTGEAPAVATLPQRLLRRRSRPSVSPVQSGRSVGNALKAQQLIIRQRSAIRSGVDNYRG